MGKRRITSKPGWLGYTYFYDEKGKCIGKSRPGAFGSTVYFDEKGRYAGKGRKGIVAEEVFVDKDFKRCIHTYKGFIGESHYENGKWIGHSAPGWLGTASTTVETEDDLPEDAYFGDDLFEEDALFDEEPEWETEPVDEDEEDTQSVTQWEEDTPKEHQSAVVRNLLLFVLCLVICGILACIFLIRAN